MVIRGDEGTDMSKSGGDVDLCCRGSLTADRGCRELERGGRGGRRLAQHTDYIAIVCIG